MKKTNILRITPTPFYSFATIFKSPFSIQNSIVRQFLQRAHTSPYSCKVRRDGVICFPCSKNLSSKMSSKTFFPIPPYYWIFCWLLFFSSLETCSTTEFLRCRWCVTFHFGALLKNYSPK